MREPLLQTPARLPRATDAELQATGLQVEHLRPKKVPDLILHRYVGTKRQLVKAGIVDEGAFPGDPGCGVTSCSYDADGSRSKRGRASQAVVRIFKKGPECFIVCLAVRVGQTGAARLPGGAPRLLGGGALRWRDGERKLMHEADERAEWIADSIPVERQQLAKRVASALWDHIQAFWAKGAAGTFVPGNGALGKRGLRAFFSEADLEAIDDCVRELYWSVVDATPTYSRSREVMKARAEAARLDRPLQIMLGDLRQQLTRRRAEEEDRGSGPPVAPPVDPRTSHPVERRS